MGIWDLLSDYFQAIRHIKYLLVQVVCNKYKIGTMSELNSSLIGYLKKKSLFSQSPNKLILARDRSKQKRSIAEGRTPRGANLDKELRTPNSQSSKNLHQETSFRNYRGETESELGHQSMQVEKQSRFNNFNNSYQVEQSEKGGQGQGQGQGVARRSFNFQNTNANVNTGNNRPMNANTNMNVNASREEQSTNMWTGLVNYANSFESARIESAQCLQTMSIKLQAQLSSINYRIDSFHTKMIQTLNKEFSSAKQKIYAIVNKVFEQSQQNIRLYIKQQEETLAHQLLQMREIIGKEYQKVEMMKEEINKPSWRKVAGELLSTELEEKVEMLLGRSRGIDVRQWEVGDLGIGKVASLETHLRDMIKLTSR